MNIAVVVNMDAGPDTVRQRLIASFDRPLSDKRHLPTIGPWTVFGEVRGDEIRAESAGAFEGWTARTGYGFWQPIFRGRVRSTTEGSVVEGSIRFRLTVWILVLFLVVLAMSLVPPLLPIAGQDIAAGNYGRAVPPLVLILGIVVLPAAWTAREHLRILSSAGLVRSKRIKQWTFYSRDERRIAQVKRAFRTGW